MKLTNEQRKAIYRRDGYRCALCDSSQYLQVHHYIPRGRGGSNSPHNLVTLCHVCHGQVHGLHMIDSPDEITQEEIEQLIVEYLADYYAPDWNPWRRE
jgi:predicted HNH restriction endonuclease